jgi:broad specificity phosphatase PhoE
MGRELILRGSPKRRAPQDDSAPVEEYLMPTIYYIRHGETDWNAQGRLQGGRDIPLNDLGRKQATLAGGILAGLLAREGRSAQSLDFVASPLGRARRTMELVRGALSLPPQGYALDDRLREIGYGRWEGSTFAQMRASDPELFARRRADKWKVPPPDGESYAEVQARMRDWYDGLTADTVAVAHGGTARALMVALGIETPAIAADLGIEQGVVYVFEGGGVRKYR